MIFFGLGKRQRFAHKPTQALAQRVVPSLDVGCFSGVLADAAVILAKHRLVRLPKTDSFLPMKQLLAFADIGHMADRATHRMHQPEARIHTE